MPLIHGRVVDSRNQPLADAAIYIVSGPASVPDVAQITDDQGEFKLAAPVSGSYRIGARAEPWGTVQADVEVRDDQAAFVKLEFPNQ